MAGVQFPATGCGCPKRGAKAQTSAAEPMGSGPIGSQQICCLCTRKKHEEEFKDLAFYELHFFVFVGFATKTPPFVFPSDDLEGT